MSISEVNLLVSIASVLVTTSGVGVAIFALHRWRHEFSWKETYNAYVQCELSIYEYHKAIKSLGRFYFRNTQIQLNRDALGDYVEKDSETALVDLVNTACENLRFQQDWLSSFSNPKTSTQIESLLSPYIRLAIAYTKNCSFCGFLEEEGSFDEYRERRKQEADELDMQFTNIKSFLRKKRGA